MALEEHLQQCHPQRPVPCNQEIPEMQCLLFSHKKYKNKKRGIKTPPIKHYFELKNSVHSSLFSIQGRISFKSIYLSVALRNSLAIIPSVETTVI